MATKLTGMTYVFLNGQKLRSKPEATMSPGGKIAEAVADSSGICGHRTKEIAAGKIECTLICGADTDVSALQEWEGTAVFATDSGQTYGIAEAKVTGEVKIKGGESDVTIEGQPAQKM